MPSCLREAACSPAYESGHSLSPSYGLKPKSSKGVSDFRCETEDTHVPVMVVAHCPEMTCLEMSGPGDPFHAAHPEPWVSTWTTYIVTCTSPHSSAWTPVALRQGISFCGGWKRIHTWGLLLAESQAWGLRAVLAPPALCKKETTILSFQNENLLGGGKAAWGEKKQELCSSPACQGPCFQRCLQAGSPAGASRTAAAYPKKKGAILRAPLRIFFQNFLLVTSSGWKTGRRQQGEQVHAN